MQFSIVIIARNEAHSLPHLFFALGEYSAAGGEIVLVDTGSTDETVACARSFGCRVTEMGDAFATFLTEEQVKEINDRFSKQDEMLPLRAGQRIFHFGEARNFASSLAENDMVFHLDAADRPDAFEWERIGDQLNTGLISQVEFRRIVASDNPARDTVSFSIANFYDRRLFRWHGSTHEVVRRIHDATPRPGETIVMPADVLCLRHIKDAHKERNYLAGLALQAIAEPDSLRWTFYLGRELYYRECYHSALALLHTYAALENTATAQRSESLCIAARCFEALGLVQEAESEYRRAAQFDPTRREPLLRLAHLRQRQGDLAASVEYARAALTIPRTNKYMEADANYADLPHAILYWGLFWLGETKESRQHWERCLEYEPENVRYREHTRLFLRG